MISWWDRLDRNEAYGCSRSDIESAQRTTLGFKKSLCREQYFLYISSAQAISTWFSNAIICCKCRDRENNRAKSRYVWRKSLSSVCPSKVYLSVIYRGSIGDLSMIYRKTSTWRSGVVSLPTGIFHPSMKNVFVMQIKIWKITNIYAIDATPVLLLRRAHRTQEVDIHIYIIPFVGRYVANIVSRVSFLSWTSNII